MEIKEIIINPKRNLIFDNKVVEQCKNCKRYGEKATCPPHIANSEYYQKLLPTYKHGIIYYKQFNIENKNAWVELGFKSSKVLSDFLLKKRNDLIDKGHYFAIAFGGGSCKICSKCTFPCNKPGESLIPMEATGLNIVKMMKKYDIEIKHPVIESFYRIGCVFYD